MTPRFDPYWSRATPPPYVPTVAPQVKDVRSMGQAGTAINLSGMASKLGNVASKAGGLLSGLATALGGPFTIAVMTATAAIQAAVWAANKWDEANDEERCLFPLS